MKAEVKKVSLGDVAILYDSLHKTPQYSEEGYFMVRVTDIKYVYLNLSEAKKVNKETFQEFTKKYKPQVGDTIFSRVGSYGNSSYLKYKKDLCLGQNTVCISPKHKIIEPFYLYLCLNSHYLKQQIDAFVGGSSQPTISLKNIKYLQIPYYNFSIQKKIATILSAYDDLIENNTIRIKILEQMAQSNYFRN
ncbi:restriction endonuclease subunit S [Nostoc sp.]|uniref:restriction endonuclease subunit S n=1 Tax=Nostoc sp. TaxID=1180 RepID=UPI002FF758A2